MRWQRFVFWSLVLGILLTDVGACSGPNVKQKAAPPSSESSDVMAQILEQPTRFESTTVTLTGAFQGWRGPCRQGPPVSRSDWMLTGTSGCLYVSGPVPDGLNPAKPAGEKIAVTGIVRLKAGIPYVKIKE